MSDQQRASGAERVPVVVVGAGPAGIGASLELVRRGLRPVVLHSDEFPGGQGWRQARGPELPHPSSSSRRLGERMLEELEELRSSMDLRSGVDVLGLYPERELLLDDGQQLRSLSADCVIIANGARDRVLPFPGWTLPGVVSLGGLLGLVERHGLLPRGRIVLAGSGPLLLLAASRLALAGHAPAVVFDSVGLLDLLPAMPGLLGQPALLAEAWAMLRSLRRARVPLVRRHAVLRAEGDGRFQRAVVAPLGRDQRPDLRRTQALEADLLAVGHGLAPELALVAQAGVELEWRSALGGWVPRCDVDMQTRVDGLYVAGDVCGVHGAQVALLQGRLAGIAAAVRLGASAGQDDELEQLQLRARLARLVQGRAGLERAMQPRSGLLQLLPDHTLICRCEEVSLGELRAWMARGAGDATALKMATRAGMGRCQGRFCGASLRRLLADELGEGARMDEPLSARPPARPVPLERLAGWDGLEG